MDSASKILDEVFSSIRHSVIFRDRDKLSPDYVPTRLPFREEQIRLLASILAQALRGYKPNNVFIYGLTGTGKTAVAKLVTKKLMEKAREIQANVRCIYVNCRQRDTSYRVLADIIEGLGGKVPFTGLSIAELYRRLVNKINSSGGIVIVILDEIDFLLKKHGDDILYKLTRINSDLEKGSLSIVGITNDVNLVENLDARVRSSLGEEEIIFPPYNAEQLKAILSERAYEAFNPGVLEDGVIPLCAALAAREHGDARKALDLLRVAGELAERDGSSKVTINHVYRARKELEKDRAAEVIQTLPVHAKLILLSIYKLVKEKGRGTTGEIYALYVNLTRKLGIEFVTRRRATEIINELDMLGIVNARVVSRGRYGKTKVVTLTVETDSLLNAFKKDELIAELL